MTQIWYKKHSTYDPHHKISYIRITSHCHVIRKSLLFFVNENTVTTIAKLLSWLQNQPSAWFAAKSHKLEKLTQVILKRLFRKKCTVYMSAVTTTGHREAPYLKESVDGPQRSFLESLFWFYKVFNNESFISAEKLDGKETLQHVSMLFSPTTRAKHPSMVLW